MVFHRLSKGWLLSVAAAVAFGTPGVRAEVSGLEARTSPDWLRNGVIYEIFPRDFSPAGNLAGVTARLDELHDLGVTILWTMPIHPIGQTVAKANSAAPIPSGIITRWTPIMARWPITGGWWRARISAA